jgi:predicted AlkP superfamily phosphohydrolase/phosphomutase
MKILVIGLDGADPDLLFPWAREGELHIIKKLMERGCWGELNSLIPPVSASAWASFMTGVNPGKHGIFDFWSPSDRLDHYKLNVGKDIRSKTLWRILSEHGKKVGVVNVTMTYPPEKVNGFIVSGFDAPNTKCEFTYPVDLGKKLVEKFSYELSTSGVFGRKRKFKSEDEIIAHLSNLIEIRKNACMYLMDKWDWNFFMVMFGELDGACHRYMGDLYNNGKYKHVIPHIYQKLDTAIGELLTKVNLDRDIVILMSDHGSNPSYKNVYINNLLASFGFIELKKEKKIIKDLLTRFGITRDKILYITNLLQITRKLIPFLKHIPTNIKATIPGERLDHHDIKWENTLAYAGGQGRIFLNQTFCINN